MNDRDMELEKNISEAAVLCRGGELDKAIDRLSCALDILVAQAKEYAQGFCKEAAQPDSGIDPVYMSKFNEYLKKDKTAAMVSNDMARIFMGLGNSSSARIFFEQAIDLTPAGTVYDDPHLGLESLKKIK